MNIRELTYVALKITGILCFLWAFRMWEYAASIILLFNSPPDWTTGLNDWPIAYLIIGLLPFVLTLIIAAFLLARTNLVIRWLSLPETQSEAEEIKVEAFMSAAFAIMGIALLVMGISKLVWIPGQIIAYRDSLGSFSSIQQSMILSSAFHNIAEISVKIVLGFILFFGGGNLARFWKRYRDRTKLIDY